MKPSENYQNGINLGGWLSQFSITRKAHFDTFIREEDIKQIAGWGADHVRLPVDYDVIEMQSKPYGVNEEGFFYVDRCLQWCEKYHLNVILDLHHVQGHMYGEMEKVVPLFSDPELHSRFLKIWENLTKRYQRIGKSLVFELLNEISDASGYLWNDLYTEAVKVIHNIDKNRTILIGSNEANSVFTLNQLRILNEPNLVYNFHFYDPMIFTHQKAQFSKDIFDFNTTVQYPGDMKGFPAYIAEHREYLNKFYRTVWDEKNDKALMSKYLSGAENFIRYTGCKLYCGEFGVIKGAPEESAQAWIRDLRDMLDTLHIGHAYWTYKEMDFGLVDKDSKVIRPQIVKALYSNQ